MTGDPETCAMLVEVKPNIDPNKNKSQIIKSPIDRSGRTAAALQVMERAVVEGLAGRYCCFAACTLPYGRVSALFIINSQLFLSPCRREWV